MQPDKPHFSSLYGLIMLTVLLVPLVTALGLAFRRRFLEWIRGTQNEG